MIPGAPATAARTEQVIEATLKAGRLVLVETRIERLAEWGEWFGVGDSRDYRAIHPAI